MKNIPSFILGLSLYSGIGVAAEENPFPFDLPEEKPAGPLSAAVQRNYDAYPAARPEDNELFTQFRYTELQGFDYNGGDGTISRRDPTKVLYEKGKYYVWYTKRHTPGPPQGYRNHTEALPSADWDLGEIWYATSEDGFTWEEQGAAVPRPPKPQPGWRAVTTPGILKWKDRYYLYYQAFSEAPGTRGDDCPVSVAWSDSPDGPWTPTHELVIPNGPPGSWDQYSIHDPYPLVHDGRIYLYYKSDFDGDPRLVRMGGLAIAEDPLGPFEKHPLNPVLNSGHEVSPFPFGEGLAVMVIKDGNEHFTIQYAEDWVNFEIASIVELMPTAAGPYVADAFADSGDGRGITWGLSHFVGEGGRENYHGILARFDCDLSKDLHDLEFKRHHWQYPAGHYFKHGLSEQQKARIRAENRETKQP